MRIPKAVVVVVAVIVVVVLLVGWSRHDGFSVDPAIYGLGLHGRPRYLSTDEPSPTQAMEARFGPGSEVSYRREGYTGMRARFGPGSEVSYHREGFCG